MIYHFVVAGTVPTPKGVAATAADVGYESEAAFNRAFKRAFGTPPARYRREKRNPAAALASI